MAHRYYQQLNISTCLYNNSSNATQATVQKSGAQFVGLIGGLAHKKN